jgi:hypothetical protein
MAGFASLLESDMALVARLGVDVASLIKPFDLPSQERIELASKGLVVNGANFVLQAAEIAVAMRAVIGFVSDTPTLLGLIAQHQAAAFAQARATERDSDAFLGFVESTRNAKADLVLYLTGYLQAILRGLQGVKQSLSWLRASGADLVVRES